MLITKKINNSVAMAQDAEGHELVVFGKGIGFPAVPYELADESCIQRVFRHVNDDLMQTIASISPEMLEAALDIVRMAERELDCKLNPNLYLMLADHLQFSADRFARGIVIENPLAGEIPFVYPHEYELGQAGVRIVEGVTGKEMPEQEACSIALHVANAELGGGSPRPCTRSWRTSRSSIPWWISCRASSMRPSINRPTATFASSLICAI